MSLIFHRFPDELSAHSFMAHVYRETGLDAQVFSDQAAAYEHDPFPFELQPPIVHVDRPHDDDDQAQIENRVEGLVDEHGGEFAGT